VDQPDLAQHVANHGAGDGSIGPSARYMSRHRDNPPTTAAATE